jgi:cysteine desulfurase/selenocysteine lyase
MGYENLTASDTALWSRYRDHFPVTEKLVYLNHAGVAPLCKPAADAMQWLTEDTLRYGSTHYDQWMDAYEGLRVAAAKLINATRSEIAIVKNTSEGVATVALGIDWKPGDKIVGFEEEFPANYYPWKRLEDRGVRTEWLSATDPLDKIDKAAAGARLLALSYVQYLSGHRVDINAIGEICARRGCLFFLDAIQGMGAFPIDVRAARIHALAADGHKWMLGPEGCGVLYVQQDIQDLITPVEFGYTNVAKYSDYAQRDMTLRPDAGRYECGTLNTVGCFGLRAALDFILEVGVDRIGPQVQATANLIAEGVRTKGYELLGKRTPETGAGIVSFRKPEVDNRFIVRQLKEKGFITAPRQGWVRTSPHFYISPGDVEELIEALP